VGPLRRRAPPRRPAASPRGLRLDRQPAATPLRALESPAALLEEASRNLRLKYPDAVRGLAQLLAAVTVEPEAPSADIAWALEQGLPPKDAPIPAAAVHARCEVLVTGDRAHFGAFYGRHLRGVEVLSPAEALERLLG
jgi:hypothetical protein